MCLLCNTLRLAIVAAVLVIGKLVGSWELDMASVILFGIIYAVVRADCSLGGDDGED